MIYGLSTVKKPRANITVCSSPLSAAANYQLITTVLIFEMTLLQQMTGGAATTHLNGPIPQSIPFSISNAFSFKAGFVVLAKAASIQNVNAQGIDLVVTIKNVNTKFMTIGDPLDSLYFTATCDGNFISFPDFIPRYLQGTDGQPSFHLPYYLDCVMLGNRTLSTQEFKQNEFKIGPNETMTVHAKIDRVIDPRKSLGKRDFLIEIPLALGSYLLTPRYILSCRATSHEWLQGEALKLPPLKIEVVQNKRKPDKQSYN